MTDENENLAVRALYRFFFFFFFWGGGGGGLAVVFASVLW